MSFQFDSLAAFYAMGGHGPFVWLSYLFTLMVLVWLVASPLLRARRLRAALARRRPGAGHHRSAEEKES